MTLKIRRPVVVGLSAVLALSATAIPASAQDSSPAAVSADECVEPEPSEAPSTVDEALSMPEDFRIELFDGVWESVRDFYVDPDTNGVDWETVGDEYAPLIFQTDNAHEIYEILVEMVEELGDPFTNFYSPEDLGDPASFDPTYGGIGALIDGPRTGEEDYEGLRILYVFEGGSARDAGIDARDRIIGVNGDACARIADIRGPEGTDVTLTVVSPGETPRDVVLERRRIDPLVLPEARRLEADPSVGYLRLPSLSGQEVIDSAVQALTRFTRGDDAIEGLVLDVRATSQGAPRVIIEILQAFVSGEVGELHSRVGDEPLDEPMEIEPNDLAEAYAGVPVVVLVDDASEAEAEQFAAILQDQGRAMVIGQQTSGETHGANDIPFRDGSLLQIVSFGFRLPDGEDLEGKGITPDVVVDEDWLAYPESEDPGLLAALEVIDAERAAAASPAPAGSPAAEASSATEASSAAEASPAPTPGG